MKTYTFDEKASNVFRYGSSANKLLVVIFVITLVWAGDYYGYFDRLNKIAYDLHVKISPASSTLPRTLLIEADYGAVVSTEDWSRLAETLRKQGARLILFTFYPTQESSFYTNQAGDDMLFGRPVYIDPANPETYTWGPHPDAIDMASTTEAPLAKPVSDYGTYRYQRAWVDVDSKREQSLLLKAASMVEEPAKLPDGSSFLVNFNGAISRIPQIGLKRVLAGELVEEMVRDKIVIIGHKAPSSLPGLRIPVSARQESIDPVEFYGFAMETLLTGEVPRETSSIVLLIALAVAGLIVYQIHVYADLTKYIWANLALVTTYTIASLILFSTVLYFFPIVTLIAGHSIISIIVGQIKVQSRSHALQKILIESTAKLHQRFFPTSFYDSPEHWTQVVAIVNQVLDLRRAIFLDKVPGDHRVREVIALNCSIDDIGEMRRDYERTPYSTAIKKNGPIKLERSYLSKGEEDEQQYLVPLIFSGEVLGFWAFGVDVKQTMDSTVFGTLVKEFSVQISELLYHRNYAVRAYDTDDKAGTGLLEPNRDMKVFSDLEQTVDLMEGRLGLIETVLDSLGVATILYDLFGRVIHLNKSMAELTQAQKFKPFEMTALDFISSVTGSSQTDCRNHIQNVVVNHRNISLPSNVRSGSGSSTVLNIYPVIREDIEEGSAEQAVPFRVHGILCELWDTSKIEKSYQYRERVMWEVFHKTFDHLDMADHSVKKLSVSSAQYDAASKQNILSSRKSLNESMKLITKAADMLSNKEKHDGAFASLPADSTEALKIAFGKVSENARDRKVQIRKKLIDEPIFVVAVPGELAKIFEDVMSTLLQHTVANNTLKVQVSQENGNVKYDFASNGFGVPKARLHDYLFGDNVKISKEYRKIRFDLDLIKKWGGDFQVSSDVGKGMNFKLGLKKFI